MSEPRFRLAKPLDMRTVSSISRRAYERAYLDLIGKLPRPATEDYSPWIADSLVWICEIDGEPVGVLVLEHDIDFWTIWSIAIDPAWQGQGLGMILIDKAITLARAEGMRTVRLHTNSKMEGNIALYRRAGFHQVDVKPHPAREGHELVHMQKNILS